MRHVRFTATPSPDQRLMLFELIASTEWVSEARLINWNLGGDHPAGLFVVKADRKRFEAALVAVPEVSTYDIATLDSERFALYLTLETPSSLAQLFEVVSMGGLIFVGPIVYHDGSVFGNWVGQSEEVQVALESLPAEFDIVVDSINKFDVGSVMPTASLSERQLEAIRVASGLGYYEIPRKVTHAKIADSLNCSPSTATIHLQKAEAKLVTGVLASFTY